MVNRMTDQKLRIKYLLLKWTAHCLEIIEVDGFQ